MLTDLYPIVAEIAHKTGQLLIKKWPQAEIAVDKGDLDFATNLDIEAENMIIKNLNKHFPNFNIIAEESGHTPKKSEYTWVIDPLDGTKNYFRQLPFFNISIALQKDSKTIFGLVYAPVTREMFHATLGQGAYLTRVFRDRFYVHEEHEKISVSPTKKLNQAIIHMGFPGNTSKLTPKQYKLINHFIKTNHRSRDIGSAALALAYVALGAYDGFLDFCREVKLHDVAAGVLLIQEAGGQTTNLQGKNYNVKKDYLIATNGHLHKEVLKIFRSAK